MIIIAILLFAFVTLSLATVQRNEHFSIIKEGKMTSAVKRRWAIARVVVFGALGFGFWLIHLVSLWGWACLAVGSLAAFSLLFRRGLNKMEGWDKDYLGSTSKYDVLLIRLSWAFEHGNLPSAENIMGVHQSLYRSNAVYKGVVHRAGKMASFVEATVYVVFTLWAL